MEEKEYSVSEAVRLVGVESHVLRYWEEELQVEIRRTGQGHRVYSAHNIEIFRRVRELKERGLQLKAIRVLLDEAEGDLAKASLTEQICEIGVHTGKEDTQESRQETEAEQLQGGESAEQYHISMPEQEGLSEAAGQNPDRMGRFEEILKKLICEAMEEQSRRQEQLLRDLLREELRRMHFSYEELLQEAVREAAVSSESQKESAGVLGRIRRLLRR